MLTPSRRSFLLGAAAALLGSAASARTRGVPIRAVPPPAIAVDVTPLRLKGWGPFADLVQGVMTGELQRLFAGRVGAPGPRLAVVITGMSLTGSAGGGTRGLGGGGAASDYLEGEAVLVGPRGEILQRLPQLLSLAVEVTAFWQPGSEQRRAVALARAYADWLERRMA